MVNEFSKVTEVDGKSKKREENVGYQLSVIGCLLRALRPSKGRLSVIGYRLRALRLSKGRLSVGSYLLSVVCCEP
jgi:hypothetical protein